MFDFDDTNEKNNQPLLNTIWAEKYRPRKIEDLLCTPELHTMFNTFVAEKCVPHLLFHGNTGIGKTTVAKILASEINCDCLDINASSENNIDTVRTRITDFASSVSFNPYKIIILDEADYLTPNAQAALRNIMEKFSQTTRFILTCNYIEKIIPAINSRAQTIEFPAPTKKDIAVRITHILDTEKVKYDITDVAKAVNSYYPDIRKIINYTQQNVSNNILTIKHAALSNSVADSIINLLKKNDDSFDAIRQLIADNHVKQFDDLYKSLYDNIDKFVSKKNIPAVITIIAECIYQNAFVIHKEITFMACIDNILKNK